MSSAVRSNARFPWVGGGVLVAVVAIVLLSPIRLGRSEFAQTVENALHAPLFALVAIAILIMYRRARPSDSLRLAYLVAFVGAVLLGAAGEVAQGIGGIRHAQWVDVLNDAAGALGGLCWLARYETRVRASRKLRRGALLGMCLACVVIAVPLARSGLRYAQRWQQLPELATWRTSIGHHFVRPGTTPAAVAEIPARWSSAGELALHVGSGDGRWVGIGIEEPWPDWRDYDSIEFDVVNPTDRALELIVRIEDRDHDNGYDDRFNKTLIFPAAARTTLRIPLADVEAGPATRQMDLSRVARIVLFQDGQLGSQAYYLGAIRLAKSGAR